MNKIKIPLQFIFLVLIISGLCFISGVSSYVIGLQDGQILAGKQLSAMIYIKGRNPKLNIGSIDAWTLVENYKLMKVEKLKWHHIYLNGIRKLMIGDLNNYDDAFLNGIPPEVAFKNDQK